MFLTCVSSLTPPPAQSSTGGLLVCEKQKLYWTRSRWGGGPRGGYTRITVPLGRGQPIFVGSLEGHLAETGAVASIGTVGDSFDNALAETVNRYYESQRVRGPGTPLKCWGCQAWGGFTDITMSASTVTWKTSQREDCEDAFCSEHRQAQALAENTTLGSMQHPERFSCLPVAFLFNADARSA